MTVARVVMLIVFQTIFNSVLRNFYSFLQFVSGRRDDVVNDANREDRKKLIDTWIDLFSRSRCCFEKHMILVCVMLKWEYKSLVR